jgi:hypothetical protein
MLNTQKIHTETKLPKKLNHITNQTSYMTTNKKNCANETLISNSDMCDIFHNQ